jgi:hypothetical protein
MSRSSSKNGGLFSEVNFSTAEMTIPLDYVFVGKIPISKNGPATNICDHCHATNTFEEIIEHRHIGQNDVPSPHGSFTVCHSCGEHTDPVIKRNRRLHPKRPRASVADEFNSIIDYFGGK